MIVQLTGKVSFPITLDPTVWIFDDRKVLFEDAFTDENTSDKDEQDDQLEKAAERFNREVFNRQTRPPVNKSITRFERDKILVNSYVMPIKEFVAHAEINADAEDVTLVTVNENVNISLKELQDCYLLFSIKGKPLTENGPVHLYFRDGSNKDTPIKSIQKIVVN